MTCFEKFRRYKLFVEGQKRRNFLSTKVSSCKVKDLFVTIFIIFFIYDFFFFWFIIAKSLKDTCAEVCF